MATHACHRDSGLELRCARQRCKPSRAPAGSLWCAALLCVLALGRANNAPWNLGRGNIATIAGGGGGGVGDGGPALQASLSSPLYVNALQVGASSGVRLWISTCGEHRVRYVSAAGIMSTVAGTGVQEAGLNGVPATLSAIGCAGIAGTYVNATSGGVRFWVVEHANHRIREVRETGIIYPFAGNGTAGGSGDGGPAVLAGIHYPHGVTVAVDSSTGRVRMWLSEFQGNRVRSVDEEGRISRVVGTGVVAPLTGSIGDGGAALNAMLRGPTGIAHRLRGTLGGVELWIAEFTGHRIRYVNENGIISTIAGDGTAGFLGDGGPALSARINGPHFLHIMQNTSSDNVTLWIAEFTNSCIRVIDEAGILQRVAGVCNQTGFSGDGGPALSAIMSGPSGLAFVLNTTTRWASMYFTDRQNNRVRMVADVAWLPLPSASPSTSVRASVSVPASATPSATATASGTVDAPAIISAASTLTASTSVSATATPSATASLSAPVTASATASMSATASLSATASTLVSGSPSATASLPAAPTPNPAAPGTLLIDDTFYIDTVVGGANGSLGDGGPATSATLRFPFSVVALHNATSGNYSLIVSDMNHYRVRLVSEAGEISTIAGTGSPLADGDGGPAWNASVGSAAGLAVLRSAGSNALRLWIADVSNNVIRHVDEVGAISTLAGMGTAGYEGDGGAPHLALLNGPIMVAAHQPSEHDGVRLWVLDNRNHCVRHISESGVITTVAGNGSAGVGGDGLPAVGFAQFNRPFALALWHNASTGGVVMWIADTYNHRVRRVAENGLVYTVAGTGEPGFAGDGGPATAARLLSPTGLAVWHNASSGAFTLWIADYTNNRIREVREDARIWTIAGNGTAAFGGDGGPAAAAAFNAPVALTAHVSRVTSRLTLWVTDYNNHRIRRIYTDRSTLVVPSESVTPSPTATQTRTATGTAAGTATGTPTPSPSPSSTLSASASSSAVAPAVPPSQRIGLLNFLLRV